MIVTMPILLILNSARAARAGRRALGATREVSCIRIPVVAAVPAHATIVVVVVVGVAPLLVARRVVGTIGVALVVTAEYDHVTLK